MNVAVLAGTARAIFYKYAVDLTLTQTTCGWMAYPTVCQDHPLRSG